MRVLLALLCIVACAGAPVVVPTPSLKPVPEPTPAAAPAPAPATATSAPIVQPPAPRACYLPPVDWRRDGTNMLAKTDCHDGFVADSMTMNLGDRIVWAAICCAPKDAAEAAKAKAEEEQRKKKAKAPSRRRAK